MIRKAARLITTAICCLGLAGGQDPSVSILLTGAFHKSEVRARTGERRHGLFHASSGFQWRSVQISIRQVSDPVVDEAGEKTGIEVGVKGDPPVFLVKGIPGLLTKTVRSVLTSPEGLSLPQTEALTLEMPDQGSYTIRVADRRIRDDAPEKASRLFLESENLKQVLYQWPTGLLDQHCELIWAGDLDGDGKLDLFMALSDHYNVVEHILYLSSRSAQGNLVQRVAAFVTKGC